MLPLQKVRATPLKKGKLKKGESLVLSPSQVYTYRACLIKQKPNCYRSLVNYHTLGGFKLAAVADIRPLLAIQDISVEIPYDATSNNGDEPQYH